MLKERKVPMRMCLCCREMSPKRDLVRVVMNKEGGISVDLSGKAPGRGAYLCRRAKCVEKLLKTRALDRGFGCAVPQEVYERLQEELSAGE